MDFISLLTVEVKPIQIKAAEDREKITMIKTDSDVKGPIRIKPSPPSFSNTAAKNIDPVTGASTCALGSHMWTKNIGSFTKKAILKHTESKFINWVDASTRLGVHIVNRKEPQVFKFKIISSKGSDPLIV